MCIASVCGCAFFAAHVTCMVYFGIYAYNNPDPEAYYLEPTARSDAQLVADASADAEGVVPIHNQFIFWYKWMFYNGLAAYGLGCVAPIFMKMGLSTCSRLGLCLLNCSALVCYIIGCVYRFGEAGQFACGDDTELVMTSSSSLLMQE